MHRRVMTMTASLISEDFPTLTGRQEPHHLSMFTGNTSLGEKVIELKRRLGAPSMPWQRDAQLAICSRNESGGWTHPTCCLLCTRQNGKSEILIDRCLYGLFKLGEAIVYTAQRWKTARDAWRRMMSLIRSKSWLSKHVVKSTCSAGEGIIELASGATINFGVRSNDAFRGITDVDLLIFDEAYNLTEGEVSAMSFIQMAADNPQRIYASSAVNQDQHPNGHVLAAVRARGLAGEPRLYFAEWMAPGECDIDCCEMCALAGVMDREDPATWAYANPSYGVIQTAEKILDIKANLSTEAGRKAFDVEALGRGDWPVEDAELQPVINPEVWGAMRQANPPVHGSIALAVDMTADQRWVTIAAATWTEDDRVRLEIGYHQAPSGTVVAKLLQLINRWDPCVLVINGTSPAKSLVPELANAGIEPELTSSSQMTEACAGFYTAAVNHGLSHADDPRLNDALAGAEKKEFSGGAWGWDYRSNVVLSPLQAATLAFWGLQSYGIEVGPPPSPVFERHPTPRGPVRTEFDALTAAF